MTQLGSTYLAKLQVAVVDQQEGWCPAPLNSILAMTTETLAHALQVARDQCVIANLRAPKFQSAPCKPSTVRVASKLSMLSLSAVTGALMLKS